MTPEKDRNKAVDSVNAVHGLFLLGTLAAFIAALPGCGAANFDAVRPGLEARGHYIEGVPFVKQTEYDCGPAALASVLSFQGKAADLERITASVYLPKLRGTLPMDLERYAKDEGFKTSSSAGTHAAPEVRRQEQHPGHLSPGPRLLVLPAAAFRNGNRLR